jgi:hypothetical protein
MTQEQLDKARYQTALDVQPSNIPTRQQAYALMMPVTVCIELTKQYGEREKYKGKPGS